MSPTGAPRVLGILHKQIPSEPEISEITVKIHREDGAEFYGNISEAS